MDGLLPLAGWRRLLASSVCLLPLAAVAEAARGGDPIVVEGHAAVLISPDPGGYGAVIDDARDLLVELGPLSL